MSVNTTNDQDKTDNSKAANDFSGEPHGNRNEKLNENHPQDVSKEQRGDMTPEEYTNQPESNINATTQRDIDVEPEKLKSSEDLQAEINEAENRKQLEKDLEAERKRDEQERRDLEQKAHAADVSERQNAKLDSNTKDGEQK